jgi:hypothetical protein
MSYVHKSHLQKKNESFTMKSCGEERIYTRTATNKQINLKESAMSFCSMTSTGPPAKLSSAVIHVKAADDRNNR